MTDTYSVHRLTLALRDLIEADSRLQDVWVEGEVSNFRRAPSGHLYFTLKDEHSELPCVMWRAQAAQLAADPPHGSAVLAHGRVTVYEARGQYQLVCDLLQPAGVGELNRQFERLKAQLSAEGLFDPARKRPIPAYPRQIGVVTSPTTAAFQDVQNVIRRRFPAVELVLSPTLVQGREAPSQIIEALCRLNDYTGVDVILMIRGGGSLEDLWCFNDEAVVRAVAGSRIPVVTGVGHEIDFTLVDFAADQRAPTPSAAAELVTPDGPALLNRLDRLTETLHDVIRDRLADRRSLIGSQVRLLKRLSPRGRVQNARQRVDDRADRLALRLSDRLARARAQLDTETRALESSNPAALLRRGYAMVTRVGDGRRVTSVQLAAEGTAVHIQLHDGRLTAQVRQRDIGNE